MKRIFTVLLLFFSLLITAQINSFSTYTIANTGGATTIPVYAIPNLIVIDPDGGAVTMSQNYTMELTGYPADGQTITVFINPGFNINGHSFSIFGQTPPEVNLLTGGCYYVFTYEDSVQNVFYSPLDMSTASILSGAVLRNGTVDFSKLATLTSGNIIVGNSGNVAASVAMTGDIAISNAGVTSIGSGVIVNADVNASAAIARSKLAAGSNNYVVINDGSGVMTNEAQLATSRGGLGTNASSSTGFVTFNSGTATIDAIYFSFTVPVWLDSTSNGDLRSDNKVYMPFAGTVTGVYGYVSQALSATDSAYIIPKNQAGTTMTNGTISFEPSTAKGTAKTSSPSANNTFIAGDVLSFSGTKVTPGGYVLLTVTGTRNE